MKKLKLFEREWLQKVDQLIDDNMDNTHFKSKNLAFQLNLSNASCYRKIVKLTGKTPADYIRHKRLTKARELQNTNSNYSIQELAVKVFTYN